MVRHMAAEAMQAAAEGDDNTLMGIFDELSADDLNNMARVAARLGQKLADEIDRRRTDVIRLQLISALSIKITGVWWKDVTCAKCDTIGPAPETQEALQEMAVAHLRETHAFEVPVVIEEDDEGTDGIRLTLTMVDAAQIIPKGECYGAGGPKPCLWVWIGGATLSCTTPH